MHRYEVWTIIMTKLDGCLTCRFCQCVYLYACTVCVRACGRACGGVSMPACVKRVGGEKPQINLIRKEK